MTLFLIATVAYLSIRVYKDRKLSINTKSKQPVAQTAKAKADTEQKWVDEESYDSGCEAKN